MAENPPTMNNTQANIKPNRLRALAFLKVGIFEIIFVAVVLLLLFGTLNYFNILPVSDVFPNQLGWLPRQQSKLASQGESLQSYQNKIPPASQFVYDTAKAEVLLTQYIKDTIKPEFLPDKIEIKQGLYSNNKSVEYPYEFSFILAKKELTIYAYLNYQRNTNIIGDMEIFVDVSNSRVLQSTITASLSNSQVSQYLLKPSSLLTETNCVADERKSYCQIFETQENNKSGFGFVIYNNVVSTAKMVFSCSIPKESGYYNEAKSCIAQ